MPVQAFLPGYVLYLLFIFSPGIGFSELFGLWNFDDTLVGRIAIALGLGLSADTLVILIRTAGFAELVGLDYGTIILVIVAGIVALSFSLVMRRKFLMPAKPVRADYVVAVLVLALGLMVLLHFEKYPIFPEYLSHDFGAHVQFSQDLISGAITSIPGGILYDGIYYQLAPALLLVGGEPLVTVQRIMGLLVTLSPLLLYLATKVISSSRRVGLIGVVLYTFSGTIWFDSVFDSGLYANFIGILAALFLIFVFIMAVQRPRSPATWVIFFFALVNAYMSHYTILSLFPALLLIPLIQFLMRKPNVKTYSVFGIISILPPIISLILFPTLASIVLPLLSSGRGVVLGGTTLSVALSSVPVLSYMAVEVYDDIALVCLLILVAVSIYRAVKSEESLIFLPVIWLLALLIVAPENVAAWRYSYEALVPILILASYGLEYFFPNSSSSRRKGSFTSKMKSRQSESILPRATLIIIIVGGIIVGSWGQYVIADSVTETNQISQAQIQDYAAMQWMKANTPNNSQYLSTSDWNFVYTNLTIGRNSVFEYARTPSDAIKLAENSSAEYIIVTNVATLPLPPVASLFPWSNFPNSSNSNLTLLYQNPNVKIYQISNDSH